MENEKVPFDKEVIFYSALTNAWINTKWKETLAAYYKAHFNFIYSTIFSFL